MALNDTVAASLKGKRIMITGGTSGIGKDLVELASQAGADVFFTYNSGEDRAKELYERTNKLGTGPRKFVLGDQISTRAALDCRSNIDYFIANAGVELSGDLTKHTFDEINRVVTANLTGNLYLLQHLITSGKMSKGGQIAVIGSIAASGNHDQFAYSPSKAGLRGAVESLSRYDARVREQELGVKLLEPAFVRTPMTERILKLIERRVIPKKGGDELVKRFNDEHIVMDSAYAAAEILRLTVDPAVKGVRTIPEGVNLHDIRATYF